MAYTERNVSQNKQLAKETAKSRHALFRKRSEKMVGTKRKG
jgi:hypothetical protein